MLSSKTVRSLSVLRWLLLLPIPIAWCILHHDGLLTFLENKSLDWRFVYRGEVSAPVKVVYIDVDTPSLDPKSGIGGWPWSRMYFAKVGAALVKEGQVRAVGYDFVFSSAGLSESVDFKKHVEGNLAFRDFLMQEPPVVLAASYGGWSFTDIGGSKRERTLPVVAAGVVLAEAHPPELPEFELTFDLERPKVFNPPFVGLIDTLERGTREVPAWVPTNFRRNYYHMAIELARLYWRLPPQALVVGRNELTFMRADGSAQARVPLTRQQMLEVNWFTPWQSDKDPHLEFVDVYKYAMALEDEDPELRAAGKRFFADDIFKDAIVLVGPVDPVMQDLATTPLDPTPVPKVGVHGNLVKTIVSGAFIQRLPLWTTYAIVFGLTLVVTTLAVAGGARAMFAKIMAVLATLIYVALAFRIFEQMHVVLPFTAPLGAALTTSFAGLIWQVIDEQKAKHRVKGMFGTYISPQLVEQMVESGEDPKLGGHEEQITAYFSDIQGFSSFSEKLPPARLVELMNEYLTACTDIVTAQGGTLDKYIGDAVVAMFGAPIRLPDHALRACVASQLVHQRLGELREKWKGEGEKWPEIVWKMQSRIGLNSGNATIGNMGSRTRFNYTMMGDNVNLAARMESGAKRWGAYTMVSEATKAACEQHGPGRVVFRRLGRIVVMGRSQAVPIHEVVGLSEALPPAAAECIGTFEQGLTRFYERDWDGAIELFKRSAGLELNQPGLTPGVKTNPSLVYVRLTEEFKLNPPVEGWNGDYEMTEK